MMLEMAVAPPPADSAKEELIDMIQRFLENLVGISERIPFTVDRQKFRSIATLAAISVAIFITWKVMRAPPALQRRRPRRSGNGATVSGARLSSNSGPTSLEYCSADLRLHDRVGELIQSGKRTLDQIVRHRLIEGRKERVLLALKDAGLFTAGGLNREKVLFCSTENGRISFVRQLEPDWHIDTCSDIINQLARFIKYQIHISPARVERAAANVFSATSLEQFFGVPDQLQQAVQQHGDIL